MTESQPELKKKPRLFRRIYDWVLHWANTPYAPYAAMLTAFTSPWLIPVPPDLLLIPLFLAKPDKTLRLAFLATILYAAGWFIGYAIGYYGYIWLGQQLIDGLSGFLGVPNPNDLIPTIKNFYDKYGIWAVIASAATPITDKLFSIGSGILTYDFTRFSMAVGIGSIVRIMGEAILVKIYGPPIILFVEKFFEWVVLAVLIAIFIAFWIFHAL